MFRNLTHYLDFGTYSLSVMLHTSYHFIKHLEESEVVTGTSLAGEDGVSGDGEDSGSDSTTGIILFFLHRGSQVKVVFSTSVPGHGLAVGREA